VSIPAIFDTIESLVRGGKTVLYTTHYMEEVERLCEQVVIMDHGRVIANDTLSNLKSRTQSSIRLRLDLDTAPSLDLIQALSSIPNVSEVRVVQHQLQLTVPAIDQTTESILATLRSHATACSHISSDRPNLEAIFLELTGRNLRDA
jgi:ABC-2 type transport system ATP-binding protein